MTHIIDRRLNSQDRQLKNRKSFIDQHKKEIKEQVKRIIDSGDVDISTSNKRVRVKPTSEPTFRSDPKSGNKQHVLPGNRKYVTGDKIERPQQGQGGAGGTEGSPDGEGEVDFEFILSNEEFRDFVFEELELPDFIKKQLKNINQFEVTQAGFRTEGTPSQLDIVRSLKNSMGRRIGLKRPKTEEILQLERMLEQDYLTPSFRKQLEDELEELMKRRKAIPWIDPFDVRYRDSKRFPKPHTQAVMFCVMDVSYSMGEKERDIAKRFFMLLNLFLQRKYNNVHVIFIPHHATAWECDEDNFFRGHDAGGTVVSSATTLVEKIIKERYKPEDWNIYIAQASDGDNFSHDNAEVSNSVARLLKICQYYAYIEVVNSEKYGYSQYMQTTGLWNTFKEMIAHKNLAMQQVADKKHVWKVFSNLFHRSKKDDKHIYGDRK